jgi:transcriptional regulator with XRE-family HTH domain
MAKSGFWKIEHGLTQPTIPTLEKVAAALGTTAGELLAEPRAAHPDGEAHDYRIACSTCGARGVVRLSVDPEFTDGSR